MMKINLNLEKFELSILTTHMYNPAHGLWQLSSVCQSRQVKCLFAVCETEMKDSEKMSRHELRWCQEVKIPQIFILAASRTHARTRQNAKCRAKGANFECHSAKSSNVARCGRDRARSWKCAGDGGRG